MHILSPVTDNCPSWKSGRRNESVLPDRVSNPGPLTYESGALPIALRGPASVCMWVIDLHSRVSELNQILTKEVVRRKIQAVVGEYAELMTLVKKRKLRFSKENSAVHSWLVGCFELNGPWDSIAAYIGPSLREREKEEEINW